MAFENIRHAQVSKYSLKTIGAKFCQVKIGRTVMACLKQGARLLPFETNIHR